MTGLTLFELAFRKNEWLAARQSAVASNIANANTPQYRTKDVPPFDQLVDDHVALAVSHLGHISSSGTQSMRTAAVEAANAERLHSGNDVDIEKEFMKSGETMRNFAINTQVVKAFHRMVLASVKG